MVLLEESVVSANIGQHWGSRWVWEHVILGRAGLTRTVHSYELYRGYANDILLVKCYVDKLRSDILTFVILYNNLILISCMEL